MLSDAGVIRLKAWWVLRAAQTELKSVGTAAVVNKCIQMQSNFTVIKQAYETVEWQHERGGSQLKGILQFSDVNKHDVG